MLFTITGAAKWLDVFYVIGSSAHERNNVVWCQLDFWLLPFTGKTGPIILSP